MNAGSKDGVGRDTALLGEAQDNKPLRISNPVYWMTGKRIVQIFVSALIG